MKSEFLIGALFALLFLMIILFTYLYNTIDEADVIPEEF